MATSSVKAKESVKASRPHVRTLLLVRPEFGHVWWDFEFVTS